MEIRSFKIGPLDAEWKGGETLEKLDTLNYTNIQFEASIQSVWMCDAASSEETLLTQYTRAGHQRMTWSNLNNYLPS